MRERHIGLTEQDLKQAIYKWLKDMPGAYRFQSPDDFELALKTRPPGRFEGRDPIVCTVIERRYEFEI